MRSRGGIRFKQTTLKKVSRKKMGLMGVRFLSVKSHFVDDCDIEKKEVIDINGPFAANVNN